MGKNTIGRSILMSWIKEFKSKCLVCPFVAIALRFWNGIKWVFSNLIIPKCILCPFKTAAKYLWSKSSAFFWRYRWISYVVLAVFAIAATNLIVVHIYIEFEETPSAIIKWLPDLILWVFGTDSEQLIAGGHYAAMITDMIAICAFIFAVLPIIQAVIYKKRLKRELWEEFGFEFIPVKKAGFDDLKEMLKRYKGADKLTIFCGGFDWIGINEELKNLLLEFAKGGKLTLISFRSQKKVQAAFKKEKREELFSELAKNLVLGENFKFSSGLDGVKCSVIKILGEHRFLFRQSSDEHEFNAGFLGSSKYSRQLLGILFKFVDAFVDTKDRSEPALAPTTTHPAAAGQSEQG